MKRMKLFAMPLCLLSIFLFSFCQKTETSFFDAFPVTYVQKRLEKVETRLFIKTINGFAKIDIQGTFLDFDNIDIATIESEDLKKIMYFNIINFNSDAKAQVKNDIPDNFYVGADFGASFTTTSTNLELIVAPDDPNPLKIPFTLNEPVKELNAKMHTSFYSTKNSNGQTEYSPYLQDCFTANDVLKTVNLVDTENNLAVGDTIAVLVSNIVFTKQ
jgi:hypothetical protein